MGCSRGAVQEGSLQGCVSCNKSRDSSRIRGSRRFILSHLHSPGGNPSNKSSREQPRPLPCLLLPRRCEIHAASPSPRMCLARGHGGSVVSGGCVLLLQQLIPQPEPSPGVRVPAPTPHTLASSLQHHILASPCHSREHPASRKLTSPSAVSKHLCLLTIPMSPTCTMQDVSRGMDCSSSTCFINLVGAGSHEQWLVEGLMAGRKEWIHPGGEDALLHSTSSAVTDVALTWTRLPFAGAGSWANPGCPAQDGGSGPGMGQGWVQHAPQELVSHESHQGHLQSHGVALLAAFFQTAWCKHALTSPSDMGTGRSSLLSGSPAPRGVLVTWGSSLPTAGTSLCRCAGTGYPGVPRAWQAACDYVSWDKGPEDTDTKGKMSSFCLCPPPACVPLLVLVSGKTRPIQPGPAQPDCKNSTLPCALPVTPQGPADNRPVAAGGREVPQGLAGCPASQVGGRGGPSGRAGGTGRALGRARR